MEAKRNWGPFYLSAQDNLNRIVSINTISWSPEVGGGLVYGTTSGDLRMCSIKPKKVKVDSSEDVSVAVEESTQTSDWNWNENIAIGFYLIKKNLILKFLWIWISWLDYFNLIIGDVRIRADIMLYGMGTTPRNRKYLLRMACVEEGGGVLRDEFGTF